MPNKADLYEGIIPFGFFWSSKWDLFKSSFQIIERSNLSHMVSNKWRIDPHSFFNISKMDQSWLSTYQSCWNDDLKLMIRLWSSELNDHVGKRYLVHLVFKQSLDNPKIYSYLNFRVFALWTDVFITFLVETLVQNCISFWASFLWIWVGLSLIAIYFDLPD